jgi:hypothetical protein
MSIGRSVRRKKRHNPHYNFGGKSTAAAERREKTGFQIVRFKDKMGMPSIPRCKTSVSVVRSRIPQIPIYAGCRIFGNPIQKYNQEHR